MLRSQKYHLIIVDVVPTGFLHFLRIYNLTDANIVSYISILIGDIDIWNKPRHIRNALNHKVSSVIWSSVLGDIQ